MRQKTIARPLANFLNRISLDSEVKQDFLQVLQQSKLARDVTEFARGLGYIFSEADLHQALIGSATARLDNADLSDDTLDAVVGGAGAPFVLPADIQEAFTTIRFSNMEQGR